MKKVSSKEFSTGKSGYFCGPFQANSESSALEVAKAQLVTIGLILLFLLFLGFAGAPGNISTSETAEHTTQGIRFYGYDDFRHNLGQFIPSFMAHPVTYIVNRDVSKLQQQMSQSELDLSHIRRELQGFNERIAIDEAGVNELKRALPNSMTFTRDTSGDLHFPAEFERAFRNVFKQDPELQRMIEQVLETKLDQTHTQMHSLESAQATTKGEFEQLLSQTKDQQSTMEEKLRLNRNELIELINNSQKSTELGRMEDRASLNHFSTGCGARIDPYLTAETYIPPKIKETGFYKKYIASKSDDPVKTPNSPQIALRKWEEHGDCWCFENQAPNDGKGLAVLTANEIFPDTIIIEHILNSATLTPEAAPKDMELYVLIEDPEAFARVKGVSEREFSRSSAQYIGENTGGKGFVKIGEWTFQAPEHSCVQSFYPQIALESLNREESPTYTSKFLITVKDNWSHGELDFTCLYRVGVEGNIGKQYKML